MKNNTFKKIIIYFSLSIFALYFNSCKVKDDKDFIIDVLKEAKDGEINDIKGYLTYDEQQSKYDLDEQAQFLIDEMKEADIPKKDSMKNIINNGEYQVYNIELEPTHTILSIGLIKNNKNVKIDNLFRIKVSKVKPRMIH
jgi:hypothetical protein